MSETRPAGGDVPALADGVSGCSGQVPSGCASPLRPSLVEWEAAGRALVGAYDAITWRPSFNMDNPTHLQVIRAEQRLRRLVERLPTAEGTS